MKASRTLTALLAVSALALVGCGSAEDSSDASEPEETTSAATEDPTDEDESEPEDECLQVPDAMLRAIAKGGDGVKIKPVSGAAVRSDDFEKVWMIAMEFDGVGSTEHGVWASNSLKPGGGMIMSVDGMAQEFTVWPNGAADSPMSIADHGAQEALDCL